MGEFEGHCFPAGGAKIRCRVTISPLGVGLVIAEPMQSYDFPWDQVQLTLGGAGDKLIFFKIKDDKQATEHITSFYLQKSRELLTDLAEIDHSELSIFVKRARKHTLFSQSFVAGVLLTSIALLLFLWLSRGLIIGFIVDRVPYEWEQQLGDKLVGFVVPPQKMLNTGRSYEQLIEQVSRLSELMPDGMQDVKVHIAKDPQLNAFALPGGHIIFNRGMLEAADSIEEVLGVAAHELAHVRERHVLRGMVQSLGVFLIFDMVVGDVSGIIAVLGDNSQLLMRTGFSRTQEQNADDVGFQMLTDAGINPTGLITFFERLQEETKKNELLGDAEKMLNFISSHPTTEERIKRIEEKIDRIGNVSHMNISFDYDGFKQGLSEK